MRLTLAASLLLSPMLVTASAIASQPSADVPPATRYQRVTSAVAVPAALDYATFHLLAGNLAKAGDDALKIVLWLRVDKHGNAQDVHVLQSANPELDASVVAAVMQSHFHPATMNNWPIAIDMNLTVNVKK